MTVKITRLEHSAEALRSVASAEADGKVVRRLLAIALVLEGCPRAEAAQNCGMDRQTLRDWIIRYNEQDGSGLSDQPHGGGPSAKLTDEEKAVLAEWGPSRSRSGRRWGCALAFV